MTMRLRRLRLFAGPGIGPVPSYPHRKIQSAVMAPPGAALAEPDQGARPPPGTLARAGARSGARSGGVQSHESSKRPRLNPLLSLETIDTDQNPARANQLGVRVYNTAILQTRARRVEVVSSDDHEIALAMLRAMRERDIVICFGTGHGEYQIDNFRASNAL
jgi:hypothetical protein